MTILSSPKDAAAALPSLPDPPKDQDIYRPPEQGPRPTRGAARRRRAPKAAEPVPAGAGSPPAFPPWAREAKGSGARGALEWPNEGRIDASRRSEGRCFASQNAEARWDKGSGARSSLECHAEGRIGASRRSEGRTGLSSGTGRRRVGDAEEGRGGPGASAAEAAFLAGAALAALDPLMRQEEARFHGCWAARLALQAAAASAKILGRAEDEAALRDAVCLCPPGGDPGPAGRLLDAFRMLAGRRPDWIFGAEAAGKIAAGLGLPALFDGAEGPERPNAGVTEILHAAAALAHSDRPAIFAAAEAAALAGRGLAPGAPRAGAIFALLLADAVLACRLAWPRFVPLLCTSKEAGQICLRALRTPSAGSESLTGAQRESSGAAFLAGVCLGIAGAAARAHDLYGGLARRAGKLESALPKLRAKGAASALENILAEDAVTAAMRPGGLSDRAARRLFDRLAAMGALTELSGRPAFRLYGL